MQHTLYSWSHTKDAFAALFANASPLWIDGEKPSAEEENMHERVYIRGRKGLLIMVGDVQLFHLPPQGGTVDTQFLGSFSYFSTVFPEGFEDQLPFKFSHGVAPSYLSLGVRLSSQVCGEMFGTDMTHFAKNESMLHDVLELANISGILVV